MDSALHSRIISFIWGIADDVLRDLYVRGKYRDVILPMTVLRRLDAVLEPNEAGRARHEGQCSTARASSTRMGKRCARPRAGILQHLEVHAARPAHRASQQQLKADFEAYLDGFSPNVQDILENFEFRNQIPRLSKRRRTRAR
jgi:type I restriction enzyme M protein